MRGARKRRRNFDSFDAPSKRHKSSINFYFFQNKDSEKENDIQVVVNENPASLTDLRVFLQDNKSPNELNIEGKRLRKMNDLRAWYTKICNKTFKWESEPRGSFDRWLFDEILLKTLFPTTDPLFPDKQDRQDAEQYEIKKTRIYQEIIEDFPLKIKPPVQFVKEVALLQKHFQSFVDGCRKLVRSQLSQNVAYSQLKQLLKEPKFQESEWMKDEVTLEQVNELYSEFRDQSKPFLVEILGSDAENIAAQIYELACVSAEELSKETKTDSENGNNKTGRKNNRERVDKSISDGNVFLTYKNQRRKISENSFIKLRNQWQILQAKLPERTATDNNNNNNMETDSSEPIDNDEDLKDDFDDDFNNGKPKIEPIVFDVSKWVSKENEETSKKREEKRKEEEKERQFLRDCWCLLTRYQSLLGFSNTAGGLHGALSSSAFMALNEHFDIEVECFASPLNSYFPSFCSAFVDTDFAFGSLGSFFHFRPVEGSFEANPPFCESLMEKMVKHMNELLSASNLPLSFAVVIPSWSDSDAYKLLESSSHFRRHVQIPAMNHFYRSGLQHLLPSEAICYRAVHDTSLFFLQNDAGFAKWEPTEERVEIVTRAFAIPDS